ncbi:MAG: DNA (cytosine-5-)-methyltransferase [Spirochaetales bacterium]|nr:DNA (cytosine-5-)-methyltransferase [Spirochaetales bacterium]
MSSFTFIDLFAGIGGMRLGLEKAGGECVFSSEKDAFCQKTYSANFPGDIAGDITALDPESIPDHDLLAAGFPCQPFSLAGVSKNNSLGRDHGFKDRTRGTLFFNIAAILDAKRPAALLLENVKNLKSHDGGRTFQIISERLAQAGYVVFSQVLNAAPYVPQHRERIFLVGFRQDLVGNFPDFAWPHRIERGPALDTILESDPALVEKYHLSDHLWQWHQNHARKHRAAGHGFGYGLADPLGQARTLSARYYKDGAEILVPSNGRNPRKLTPRECARLMGFPDSFQIVVSDTQAYKQFGNSVAVPLITAIGRNIVAILHDILVGRPT